MKFRLILLLVSLCYSGVVMADPPVPPLGKRWVLNMQFSDEFNGNSLDQTKWYNYHPKWKGRPPAIFLPSQVSVSDGYLKIQNKKLDKDTVIHNKWNDTYSTYNIAGGAVRSKSDEAFYGYYECRFKASKTYMSTTFWLSSNRSKEGEADCEKGQDRYGLELDIQETIGVPDLVHTPDFHTGMGANSHYWYTDCEGGKHDYHKGGKIKSEVNNSDVFNTYGMWWQNANEAQMYFNGGESKKIVFDTTASATPFNYSMAMNMVTETYSWITLPTDEELNDNTRNTSYYDWVRSYVLVDVDKPLAQSGKQNTSVIYDENVYFSRKPKQLAKGKYLSFEVVYQSNSDREICLQLFDEDKKKVKESVYPILGGMGKKIIQLKKVGRLKKKKMYTAKIFMRPLHKKDSNKISESNKYEFLLN